MSEKKEKRIQQNTEAILNFLDEAEQEGVISKDLSEKIVDWFKGENPPEEPYDKALPSRYKHNEEVRHILIDQSKVNRTKVIKIGFTESAVLYDLELECYWPEHQTPKEGMEKVKEFYYTRLYNVGSSFLAPVE
jgi:hypothetical protein